MLFDFMTFEEFVKWYTELGKLKIFWAKPVENVSLLSKEDGLHLVGIKWIVRSRIEEAVLAIAEMADKVPNAIDSLKAYGSSTKILMVPEETPINLRLMDARSALYFWDVNARTLEPNKDIAVKHSRNGAKTMLKRLGGYTERAGASSSPRGGGIMWFS